MTTLTSPWIVMKFGGTSVAQPKTWGLIAELARKRIEDKRKVLIVHSALSGVSNLLEALPEQALKGHGEASVKAIKLRHLDFARDAKLDGQALLAEHFSRLDQLSAGIALIGEASARVRAEVLALGELMASALGLACLKAHGLKPYGLDSRSVMKAAFEGEDSRAYLDNGVEDGPDSYLQTRLDDYELVLAQGFIASNAHDETVLLGRGGSDTSASYYAAKLEAQSVEIWTDVPGLFSADPRLTSGARLLTALSYEEAQEIATMGGKVLHPRSIGPARRAGIPMVVRDTFRPELPGTTITEKPGDDAPALKAVSVKTGVRLVVMEGSSMWRQAGFLAEIFACFKQCGVSVDLVSTSETNVTVSLDPDPGLDEARLQRLKTALEVYCRVQIVENTAAVSLVGYGVRRILHKLAPALEVFQNKPIRLVSQAANDLNFTVVVDEDEGRALAVRLHDSLIGDADGPVFGPSWAEITAPVKAKPQRPDPWWRAKREQLLQNAPREGGLYVYDRETVHARASAIAGLKSVDRAWFAMKANPHPELLKTVETTGVGFECVSVGEVHRVREILPDLPVDRILFTPNFAARSEYETALALGTHLTLDSLHPLQHWPELFKDKDVIIRLNPDRPRGHHQHVKTAGPKAKFGIPLDQLDLLKARVEASGVNVIGFHCHAGSGVTEPDHWKELGAILAKAAAHFPEIRILNVGGGLGIPESADAPILDLELVDQNLADLRKAVPDYQIWMEPGRYLVAEAGVLLTPVTQIKMSFSTRFIGTGTGMNSLIRPALYGARHEIYNLTKLDEAASGLASIVGPICESADLLGADRLLPDTEEGDVIIITETGAYGRVMSSHYNLREPAGELVI